MSTLVAGLTGCAGGLSKVATHATNAFSAANRALLGIQPDLVGRYEMARFYASELPADAPRRSWAGQPCPEGAGRMVRLAVNKGSITLLGDGTAELHSTAFAACEVDGGRTSFIDLPQNARAHYHVQDGRVFISIDGAEDLELRWDRAGGTLIQGDSFAVYQKFGVRTAAAGGDPHKIMDAVVAALSEDESSYPERARMPAKPVGGPADVGFGRVVRWFVNQFEPPQVVALQRDSAHRAPMADTGAVVSVFDPVAGTSFPSRVLARAAVSGTIACGGRIDGDAWLYLLDADTTRLPAGRDSDAPAMLAFNTSFAPQPERGAPDAIRDALKPVHRRLIDEHFRTAREGFSKGMKDGVDLESFRSVMYGERGFGDLEEARITPFRGPNGVMYLVSVSMRDDTGFYGVETSTYTYILDARGKVAHRLFGYRTVLAVGDTNGDGIDEVITRGGITYWNGSRWIFAEPDPERDIC